MEQLREWTLALCACAALVSLAETLLPDGAVKKTSYLVLSLITVMCLAMPLSELPQMIEAELPAKIQAAPQSTDWYHKATVQQMSASVSSLIRRELASISVTAEDITVQTSIDDDGGITIGVARISVDERYRERIDEIEQKISNDLGIVTDVKIIEGRKK